MKNLKVLYHQIYEIKNKLEKNSLNWQNFLEKNDFCCTHYKDNKLVIASSNNIFVLKPKIESRCSDLVALETIDIDPNSKPVGIEYWSAVEEAYVAYKSGDLIMQHLKSPGGYEHIKYFDEGLKCIQLSPDQEILVLITGNNKVVTMITYLREEISEVDLESEDFGEKQFITVGWGHKATQFHGSAGKAAATAKQVIIGKTDRDSGMSYITWRNDGTFFAISFFNKKLDIRQFKVFNRKGVLQFTSELAHGMEEVIAWRPSGNYIAAIQQLTDKHIVAFFEKNGLKHREFTLPFKPMEVEIKKLLWSPDSEILTILIKKDKLILLQLWAVKNYHWYLKQTIKFSEDNPLLYFTWTIDCDSKLLIVLTKENMMIYKFIWTINHSRCEEINDKAVVGVIDGDKVLLTGFKIGIVPPPMCHYSLQFNCTIDECFFAPKCQDGDQSWLNPNSFIALLDNNELALCAYEDNDLLNYRHVKSYKIEWETSKTLNQNFYSMHHFLWFQRDIILCSISSSSYNYHLGIIHLENIDFNGEQGRMVLRELYEVAKPIHHIVSSPDVDVAYILIGDLVFKYLLGIGLIETKISVNNSCDQMEVIEIEKHHGIVTFGNTNCLCINGNEIAQNITSLCIHSDFLLLTTLQHTLVCITKSDDGFKRLSMTNLTIQPWINKCEEQNIKGLSIRRLERSSNLIMAISHDSKVIMQMERGNLEVIQPRPLSLHILKNHLNCLNYFEAFDIMRKQRINLNLIYDHNPKLFKDNAETFVNSIKNPQWLNLFISDLQEEDVTKTIYNACYTDCSNENCINDFNILKEKKVESICQLLRDIMEKKLSERNLIQPILTTLVKNKHIPGLEAALRKVKEFKINESTSDNCQQSADEAIKYLLYLVDVNVLYDIALGMYDLDLTKYIASKSQKDPKEYLPYLNGLANLEENYRKFKIDNFLKRYQSALEHISKCPDKFDECIELICNHDLYASAIKLFQKNQKEYKEISQLYGQYLSRNKRYREAGIIFERSGDLDRALQMYKLSGSWQNVIILSTKMNINRGDLNELYEDLITLLKDDRRYKDAAEIYLTYLEDSEEAVSLLCEGKDWRDALRIAHTAKRLDLIETHVKPGVYQHAIDINNKINNNKEEFFKLKKRLIIVREEKAKRKMEAFRALEALKEEEIRGEFSDLLSDTSSIAGSTLSKSSKSSRISSKTYRSSKNKRKQERKVLSIKEGSAFEDLAIIRALHLIVSNTYGQRKEVCEVNRVLLNFYFDELAEKLQNALIKMLNIIEKDKHEIWPKNFNIEEETQIDELNVNNHTPHNLLEPKLLYPPDAEPCNWILHVFAPSSISV